jgi:TolA-binding protein
MPDPVKSYGAPLGAPTPGLTEEGRPKPTAPTDEQVKAAYQKYMRGVVDAAHNHFHEHVQRVRGSSQTAAPNPARGVPGIDAAVAKAGG